MPKQGPPVHIRIMTSFIPSSLKHLPTFKNEAVEPFNSIFLFFQMEKLMRTVTNMWKNV